ncbi:MAG: hypothetical protein MJK04_17930 [Psychrosphaera sp.]|nr:hypothetical protein [Psychrosphaera sp.]
MSETNCTAKQDWLSAQAGSEVTQDKLKALVRFLAQRAAEHDYNKEKGPRTGERRGE